MADIIGTPESEFLIGTPEPDRMLGLAGNDTLLGSLADDTIYGNEGDDVLGGNEQNDTVYGGQGQDLVRGGQDDDQLFGDSGDDTLFADFGYDTVFGGSGGDLINGNQNDDVLNGNEGNDTIRGGRDNDVVLGGKNKDELYGELGNDTIYGNLGADTIFGGEDSDLIGGNENNDIIGGNEGNDTVFGGQDNDLVFGGKGNDELYGDLGNDTIFGDLDNDTIFGGAGTDIIYGNEGNDVVNGNEEQDTVFGAAGNDLLLGGQQDDLLVGNGDNDTLFGNKGNDTVFGGAGNDLINGNEDNDLLNGNEGLDTIRGGQGNDSVFGGKDNDELYGEKGNDYLVGNLGKDTIFGGVGTDFLFGNEDDDVLNGNEENDTVFGGQGNDLVRGGMGNDSLFGDKGTDTIYGDLGADTLTGNAVGETGIRDIFVIGRVTDAMTKTTGGPTRADADLITDWDDCIDKISLEGGLSYNDLAIAQGTGADVANTIITDSKTGEFLVVLQNIKADRIDGTSFIPAGPATATIVATDPTATEPSSTDGFVTDPGAFTVSVPCPTEAPLAISYTVSTKAANSATPGEDYVTLSGVVVIPQGATTAAIPVTPIADDEIEAPETVTVTIDPTGGGFKAGTQNTATVTILDSPPVVTKPLVFVTAPSPTTTEGSSQKGTFQFARTGSDITKDLTINFTVTGTANPPGKDKADYSVTAPSGATFDTIKGTITIPAGKTVSDLIQISPQDDGDNEPTETVIVSIASSSSDDSDYFVGSQSSAAVSIQDNEQFKNTPDNALPIRRYDQSGNFEDDFTTFTEAVTTASDNDIIVALAGTYKEPATVTIDKPLTLRGPNAGLSPTTGLTATPAIVKALGSNTPVFTILPGKNVTIEGLRIEMNGDNSNAIRYQSDQSNNNVVIRQNEFTGTGPATGGVIFLDFQNGANSSATVADNLIRDVKSGGATSGIQTFRVGTATVTDNLIANLTGPGIAADTTKAGSVINANTVSNTGQQGIQLAGGSATIANNDITNTNSKQEADRGGIRLRDSGFGGTPIDTADVFSNVITNSFNGIAIANNTNITGTITVNRNNLIGNTNAGFYHGGTGAIDAKNNWWDNPAGPVPGGTGPNAINGSGFEDVLFDPPAPAPF